MVLCLVYRVGFESRLKDSKGGGQGGGATILRLIVSIFLSHCLMRARSQSIILSLSRSTHDTRYEIYINRSL